MGGLVDVDRALARDRIADEARSVEPALAPQRLRAHEVEVPGVDPDLRELLCRARVLVPETQAQVAAHVLQRPERRLEVGRGRARVLRVARAEQLPPAAEVFRA